MWLWNQVMPDLFGFKAINYWQALCVSRLSAMLTKGVPSSSSSKSEDQLEDLVAKVAAIRAPTPKYLLSGLLKCSSCSGSFVLTNAVRYQCASHHDGGAAACSVSLSVPRERVEHVILDCVETDLLNVQRLTELEQRYADAQRGAGIVVDVGPRLAQLEQAIRNITDAIAKGLVSDALASRLKAAEAERGRLLAMREKPASEPRRISAATIERRVEMMKRRLRQGGDIARSALLEIFPDRIHLQPDGSGRHLWAVFADGVGAALFDQPPVVFPTQVADSIRVGNNGSGGRI